MKLAKKIAVQDRTEKVIKIGMFVIAVVGAITALITWYTNNQTQHKQPDALKETRIETYKNLSTLIGRMISTSNPDSLVRFANDFNQNFYNGEMILVEDTLVSLAMRRYKFALDDKLNGIVNILDPQKFEKTGREVIKTCQLHISQATNN